MVGQFEWSAISVDAAAADPAVFNPELPDVSNLHQADRVIECAADISQGAAPWRIEFPQGSVIRGTAQTLGTWPVGVVDQPANFRVLSLSTSGEGRVVEDNAQEIDVELSRYNAALPSSGSDGSDGSGTSVGSGSSASGRGGFCTLGARLHPPQSSLPLGIALAGLLGAGRLRRRRPAR